MDKRKHGDFRGGRQQSFPSPKKGQLVPTTGPIRLITNNFKMTSKSEAMIFNYKVEFVEIGGEFGSGSELGSLGSTGGQLETFIKYKVLNLYADKLKMIFP